MYRKPSDFDVLVLELVAARGAMSRAAGKIETGQAEEKEAAPVLRKHVRRIDDFLASLA